MASSASLPIISGGLSISKSLSSSSSSSSSSIHHSSTVFNVHVSFFGNCRAPCSVSVLHRRWGLRSDQDTKLFTRRTKGQAVRVLANPNVTPRKAEKKEVIMVDPLEAKRLAAKQMAEIKEKETLKRRREIEAINGAWAMIGLTAGLVIEGHTGNSILSQLAGYWAAIVHFFVR